MVAKELNALSNTHFLTGIAARIISQANIPVLVIKAEKLLRQGYTLFEKFEKRFRHN